MHHHKNSGFTIVELLIVVVVIAILAAITIISYNGITSRANDSAVQANIKTLNSSLAVKINTMTTAAPSYLNFVQDFRPASGSYAVAPASMMVAYDSTGSSNYVTYIAAKSKSNNIYIVKDGALSKSSKTWPNSIDPCVWDDFFAGNISVQYVYWTASAGWKIIAATCEY